MLGAADFADLTSINLLLKKKKADIQVAKVGNSDAPSYRNNV